MNKFPPPSKQNEHVARTLARMVGGEPRVSRFYDEKHMRCIDILTAKDSPHDGITTHATVSLSEAPLTVNGAHIDLRAELLIAAYSHFERLDNAVATAAFCVLNSGWEIFPGAIFPDVLRLVAASDRLPHVILTTPFLWQDIDQIEFEGKRIECLLAIPVSETELHLANSRGPNFLLDSLAEMQADVFDLDRPIVIARQ